MCTSSIGTPSYRLRSVSARMLVGPARRARPAQAAVDQARQARAVERHALAVVDHVHGSARRPPFRRLASAARSLRALLAVQHVGARDLVLARRASAPARPGPGCPRYGRCRRRLAAQQRADHVSVSSSTISRDARRGRALRAVHREERLGHRDRDLVRLEADHRAVAADDLICGFTRPRGKAKTDAQRAQLGWRRSAQDPVLLRAGVRRRRAQEIPRRTPQFPSSGPLGHPTQGTFGLSRQVSWLAGSQRPSGLPRALRSQ